MASITFPDATNTGVPAGTKLTAYTGPMTITQDGTVIDGKIINGTLIIKADNVVIKNSQVNFNGYWGIDGEDANNLTVQDSDITGPGYNGTSNSAILGGGTFLRNDISKTENGITLQGTAVVRGNYIHDLQNSGDPHYDGISIQGGQNGVLIEGNTIIARDTSNIIINNNFGPVNNVTIRNNFLGGTPGINIYIHDPQTTNVTITGNYIAKGGYDYFSIYQTSPVISGNTLLSSGTMPSDLGDIDGGTGGSVGGGTIGVFTGTDGDDVLPAGGASNSGNEKFYGLGGNDVLRGGAGGDLLDGGDGNDTASYAGSNAGVTVNLATGKGYGGHAAGDTIVSIGHLSGSSYGDKLHGNSNVNRLIGGAGNDTLNGYGGNDVLNGSTGIDQMAGGLGNDRFFVDNPRDKVIEAANQGTDTVYTAVTYRLAAGQHIEALSTTRAAGTGAINLIGNEIAQRIVGNNGVNSLWGGGANDTLIGYGGNDVLNGGFGNDVLVGGAGKDTFVFNTKLSAAANVDRITDFSVVDDVIRLDNAVMAGLGTTLGTLSAAKFWKSTTGLAHDANDRIIYETDTGKLFYDSNGSAAGGSVHFATLSANLNLSAADFVVI